jgi:hypothetical protein
MKYAVEMGSGAVTHIPSFIKICSGIQKLVCWGDSQTDKTTYRHYGDRIFLKLFNAFLPDIQIDGYSEHECVALRMYQLDWSYMRRLMTVKWYKIPSSNYVCMCKTRSRITRLTSGNCNQEQRLRLLSTEQGRCNMYNETRYKVSLENKLKNTCCVSTLAGRSQSF